MTQSFEEFSHIGKNFAESGMNSLDTLSKGAQAIAAEAGEYASRALEQSGAAAEKIFSAKSVEEVLEVQSDYVKRSYESFVAEASRFGNLYAELAGEAYKPFENILAKAR